MIKYLIFSALLLVSCRKYNDPWGCKDCPIKNNECSCERINQPEQVEGGVQPRTIPISFLGAQFSAPKFNPSNPNVLTFYKTERNDNATKKLMIYNRATKDTVIFSDQYGFNPSGSYAWDRMENLYFSGISNIIRVNLTSGEIKNFNLKNVTINRLTWIDAIERIGFEITTALEERKYFLYSFDSYDVDTFSNYADEQGVNFPSDMVWSKDLYVNKYSENRRKMEFLNVGSGEIKSLFSFNQLTTKDIRELNYKWRPTENTFFVSAIPGGIFYTMSENSNVIRIKKACGNFLYSSFDISGDGTEIIVVRKNLSNGSPPISAGFDDWVFVKEELILMDIDGCNERLLFE